MLSTREILELIRAGFTKSEIDEMVKAEQQDPAPTPEATPASDAPSGDPAPSPEPSPAPTPTPTPADQAPAAAPSETEKLLAALGMKLDRMTAAMQRQNIGGMENPNNQITPDQVVAQIINPHINDK